MKDPGETHEAGHRVGHSTPIKGGGKTIEAGLGGKVARTQRKTDGSNIPAEAAPASSVSHVGPPCQVSFESESAANHHHQQWQ